ncbi:MAG: hypothetical protein ACRDYE_15455 [Acidimicrobiales bacterium]
MNDRLQAVWQRIDASRRRGFGEEGMTLVELMIASMLLILLSTLVLVTMNTFTSTTASVTAQYQEYDTLLPAVATIRPLIQAEVEPGPADANGAPTPGFGVDTSGVGSNPATISGIGSFSLTFYSNIANPLGPAKIVAALTNGTGTPVVPGPSTCVVKSPCHFQVQEFLPSTSGGSSTCPGVGAGSTCQYPASYSLLTNVDNVVNTSSQPLFSYVIYDPTFNNTFALTSANVATQSFPVPSATYGTSTAFLNQCAKAGSPGTPPVAYQTVAVSCPADAIQRIGMDIQVKVPGDTNSAAETASVVYRDQGNSQSPNLPFQYSAAVG